MSAVSVYPVRVEGRLDPELSRWLWLVKWILAIPHFIILYVVGFVAIVCAIAAGFVILFTGGYPRGLFDIVLGYVRWLTRAYAYAFFLTDRYPPFTLSS